MGCGWDNQIYKLQALFCAVEIVSGISAGIHTEVTLAKGSAYNLEFTLGDANNAC